MKDKSSLAQSMLYEHFTSIKLHTSIISVILNNTPIFYAMSFDDNKCHQVNISAQQPLPFSTTKQNFWTDENNLILSIFNFSLF